MHTIRLLLLEDSAVDLERMLNALQDAEGEYTVDHVTHLADAIQRAQSGAYDLGLLDLCVEDSRGIETVRRFRAVCALPFIVQTGVDRDTALEAMRAGATDYLPKDSINGELVGRAIRYAVERSRIAEELRMSRERYELAIAGASDGVWDWDLGANSVYYSDRWLELLSLAGQQDTSGRPEDWFGRVYADDQDAVASAVKAHLDGFTPHLEIEHRMIAADGRLVWTLLRGLAVRDSAGQAYRMAGSLTDITQRKIAEERLHHEALHDALTGLPNRALFRDRLAHALRKSRRRPSYSFAVLFLDMDRFKLINDSLGHPIGDQLLINLAEVLRACTRDTDTIARLGGDEFAVVLDDVGRVPRASLVADRIHLALRDPFRIDGHEVFASVSIGIAHSETGYSTVHDLLRDADAAMYQAKSLGRSGNVVFDKSLHSAARRRLELETQLRHAVERDEFRLHFQPLVELATERTVGFEALLRWQRPGRGLVMPNTFIPILEDTGLIVEVGEWVTRRACEQLAHLRMTTPDADGITVSVNVSPRQFRQSDLVDRILAIVSDCGLPPNALALEITETTLMEDPERAAAMLWELRGSGVRIDVDDFGTGHSSFQYLQQFPVDRLKIDRSFVSRMTEQQGDRAIVGAIVNLAAGLGMEVTAEGIERADQLVVLRAMRCAYGQGYLFSRPTAEVACYRAAAQV